MAMQWHLVTVLRANVVFYVRALFLDYLAHLIRFSVNLSEA